MNIILFGSTGYIGQEFLKQLQDKKHTVTCVSYRDVHTFPDYNLNDVIINCAGFTGKPNVDQCELFKSDCYYGNVIFPYELTKYAKLYNLRVAHISSGCIYTGNSTDGKGFTEEDSPNFCFTHENCSFYSGTKEHGERVISLCDNWTFRLRIPFDSVASSRNYITKLLTYPHIIDVENSFSQKQDFVRCCIEGIEKDIPLGTYNVTNTGSLLTSDVIGLIRKYLNPPGKIYSFVSEEYFYKHLAKTPRSNCVLSNKKLRNTGIFIDDIETAFEKSLRGYK